jgi:hypothetical protein
VSMRIPDIQKQQHGANGEQIGVGKGSAKGNGHSNSHFDGARLWRSPAAAREYKHQPD